MNRLDKVVVFHPLKREQLEEVLEIELGQVQQRVLETAKGQFLFRVTNAGRDFLLQEGTDQRYGARHLKRAIERHVVYPLANLLATEQVHLGDLVCIDWDRQHKQLTFVREGEGALVNKEGEATEAAAASAQAKDGKTADAPAEVVNEKKPRVAVPASVPAAAPQARKKPERS
jgi:ATP-dependent Clp protease ATP-binding subunit ClpB